MGDNMYVKLFIQNNISKIDTLYTYKYNGNYPLKIGMRVKVPFGRNNSLKIGIILEINSENDSKYKAKDILDILDYEPIINEELIKLGFWMVKKYLVGFNSAFSPILPPGDLKVIEKHAFIIDENYSALSAEEDKLLNEIRLNSNIDKLDGNAKNLLQKLTESKVIKIKFKVISIGGYKTEKMVKLNYNYLNLIENVKISDKQKKVIDYLEVLDDQKKSDILKDLCISDSPLKTLEKHKIIEIYDKIVERSIYTKDYKTVRHSLNDEQENALNGILNSDKTVSLLHGLTGSGKTEVYLDLAENIIKNGGQVIVLVPEIGLTPQMIERFKGRFKEDVSVLHSRLSQGERFDQWQKIKNGEVNIAVGARSAVFAPFSNLKMIIIDEEHDGSYRFHNSLRYDTREVAIKRMESLKGKVVLGSATPSIDSYYNANKGKYELFKLTKRAVKDAIMPHVDIVDMREELEAGNTSIFSETLRSQIEEKLNKNEQIILFLNRRGFSSFISCRNCGHVIKCDNCDISMTYHKNSNLLRCHYCGATKKMVNTCPECGSKYIKQFGVGTQRVEEEILKLFPQARVQRMDRDTTITKDSYDNIYSKVKNREVDILVGTQMLAKGLDFENVTLVGVIAADLSLYIPDFKSSEVTFQLLTQVSGRAGRAGKEGNVVIQTYTPENYGIRYASCADYEGFYNEEVNLREKFSYPPFTDLISITFSSVMEKGLNEAAMFILKNIANNVKDFKLQATNVVKVPRIKNIYKVKFTLKVKLENTEALSEIISSVLKSNKNLLDRNKIYSNIEFV